MKMIRRFRADYIKTENGTGIGIVEYGSRWDDETLAIHSLYVNKNISNLDASMIIFKRVFYALNEGEDAILQMNRFSFAKDWDKPFRDQLKIKHIETVRGRMYQASLLAHDALKRQSDISEVFDEPMRFSPIRQQKEEGNL